MGKYKLSKEISSDFIDYIIRRRLELRDQAIDEAITCLNNGLSYSVARDIVHHMTTSHVGQIIGMYNTAWHFDVVNDDDIEELCITAVNMFDEDAILESALNKMKGKKENGYTA